MMESKLTMINLVVSQYLDSINDERDFDFPFMVLIHEMDFYDIHWTHGKWEYGKDFIAKLDIDGETVQYIFQSKAGDINLSKWRNDIAPQLQEAITNTLSHPNFDSELARQIVFVTTGDLQGGAINAAQNWNDDFVPNTLKARKVEFWCKPQLIKSIENYGLSGIHSTTAQGFADHANFFGFYSNCLLGKISTRQIELYSHYWLDTSLPISKRILRATVEAEIFARALLNNDKIFEAIICYLAAIRVIFHWSYEQASTVYLDNLKQNFNLAMLRVQSLSENYLEQIIKERSAHNQDLVSAGFGGIFTYLVHLCRIFEIAGLAYFIYPSEEKQYNIFELVNELLKDEQGVGKIPSDRYAVSIIAPVLIAIHQGKIHVAQALIEKTANWLLERVVHGNSIANFDSSEIEEVNTLLGSPDLDITIHQGGGFLRVLLTDLAAFTDDAEFYNKISEVLAKTAFPTYWQVKDTVGLTLVEGQDIIQYSNIAIESILTQFDDYAYSEHISNEIDRLSLVDTFGSSGLFVLIFLLRDRYFPKQWKSILATSTVEANKNTAEPGLQQTVGLG